MAVRWYNNYNGTSVSKHITNFGVYFAKIQNLNYGFCQNLELSILPKKFDLVSKHPNFGIQILEFAAFDGFLS